MSLKKEIESFRVAFRGLADFYRSEPHARFHLAATMAVLAAGCYFQISKVEWLAVVGCIALVNSMEAMNTAVEWLTDLVSPDYHPLAGRVKDVAAGAVLLAAFFSLVVGAVVFLPRIF